MEEQVRHQCPTCGRMETDWTGEKTKFKSENLNKTYQRKDEIDRMAGYRRWHWKLGKGVYVNDIDHIEWRVVDGQIKIVGVMELTRVDGDPSIKVPDSYLQKVLDRYNKRDGQGKFIRLIAKKLETHAWLVLYRHDLSEFWVYNLTDNEGWYKNISLENYEAWLRKL